MKTRVVRPGKSDMILRSTFFLEFSVDYFGSSIGRRREYAVDEITIWVPLQSSQLLGTKKKNKMNLCVNIGYAKNTASAEFLTFLKRKLFDYPKRLDKLWKMLSFQIQTYSYIVMRHLAIFHTRSYPLLHSTQRTYTYIFRRCTLIFYLFCSRLCVATPSATSAIEPTHRSLMNLYKIYLYLKEKKKKMYESGLNDITLSYLCYFRCCHRRIACSLPFYAFAAVQWFNLKRN